MAQGRVVMDEEGHIQLTNTTKHCILHTAQVLVPHQGMHTVLPQSGSHKIDSFCKQVTEIVSKGSRKNHKKQSATCTFSDEPLIKSIEVNQFFEGALSVNDFALLVERRLIMMSGGGFDCEALHRICWSFYEMEKRMEISFPRWFTNESLYHLWLIFNTVLEPQPNTLMEVKAVNEIVKRLVELCGYTWNETYVIRNKTRLEYPEFLEAITKYFANLKLDNSLISEVIQDVRDEIVDGVLKKGHLIKKGHKRRNWKRRWFILQKTIMTYYESRTRLTIKGQLVLNGNTEVKSMPDKGKRMYCFEVTCGRTGVPFEICAEDQRSKHEWMLAIKKAIALAKVLEGSYTHDDLNDSLAGFYLLKYGTTQPALTRADSTVRNMKYQVTMARQRKRLSGKATETQTADNAETHTADNASNGLSSPRWQSDSDSPEQDMYIDLTGGKEDLSSNDSSGGEDDDDGYIAMSPFNTLSSTPPYENVAASLPASFFGGMEAEQAYEKRRSPSLSTKTLDVRCQPSLSSHKQKPQLDPINDSREIIFIDNHKLEHSCDIDEEDAYDDLEIDNSYIIHRRKLKSGIASATTLDSAKNDSKLNEASNCETPPIIGSSATESDQLESSRKSEYITILHPDADITESTTVASTSISSPTTKDKRIEEEAAPPIPARKSSSDKPPPISPRHNQFSMRSDFQASTTISETPPTPPPKLAFTHVTTSSEKTDLTETNLINETTPSLPPK